MVYCNYEKHTENTVTYLYGGYTDDITGVIKFNLNDNSFEIVKEPANSTVSLRSLIRLHGKYKSDFSKGTFKEKISYEC